MSNNIFFEHVTYQTGWDEFRSCHVCRTRHTAHTPRAIPRTDFLGEGLATK
jgi:hypothetical protein